MKQKLLYIIISAVTVLFMLPVTALAADVNGDGYDDNDFDKLQTFLNQESGYAGTTNGERINEAYDPIDPVTWTGVEWNSDSPRRVVAIDKNNSKWHSKSLAGTLDVSGFSELTEMCCSTNAITSVNVAGNTALVILDCQDNQLSSLDVISNTALIELYCNSNRLTSLDVSANTALTMLLCGNNQISSLDVGNNAALDLLSCVNNRLTTLKASSNPALTYVRCDDNQLSSLNFDASTALSDLHCDNNLLTGLDLSAYASLKTLFCKDNMLSELDLSANTALIALDCGGNMLGELNLTANTALSYLDCQGNRLTLVEANMSGSGITLTASGNGYVGISVSYLKECVNATPHSGASFASWTESGAQVSTEPEYLISVGQREYDLVANFTGPTPVNASISPKAGTFDKYNPCDISTSISWNDARAVTDVKTGGVTIGTGSFSVTGNSLTVKKEYLATQDIGSLPLIIEYDIGNPATLAITVSNSAPSPALSLSVSPHDGRIYTNGRVRIIPNITGGVWDYDEEYLSRDGNTFTGLKTGITRVTYSVGQQSAYMDIVISQAVLPVTGQDYLAVDWMLIFAGCIGAALLVLTLYKRKKERAGE